MCTVRQWIESQHLCTVYSKACVFQIDYNALDFSAYFHRILLNIREYFHCSCTVVVESLVFAHILQLYMLDISGIEEESEQVGPQCKEHTLYAINTDPFTRPNMALIFITNQNMNHSNTVAKYAGIVLTKPSSTVSTAPSTYGSSCREVQKLKTWTISR